MVPAELREEVMRSCHAEPLAGHFGFKKTYQRIKERFFWKRMSTDVLSYCESCVPCQSRRVAHKPRETLSSIQVSRPFQIWGMDFLGPLPRTRSGNRWILVFGDLFTKWLECQALPDSTAETVARCIMDNIICRYGPPEKFLSDRGSNFLSVMVENLIRMCNSTHVVTTSYHPQTNGFCESANKIIATQLSMYISMPNKTIGTYTFSPSFLPIGPSSNGRFE